MIAGLKRLAYKPRLLWRCYRLLRAEIGRRESLRVAWRYVRAN